MPPRLGDTLLMMIMAENLRRSGLHVVVYGDYIYGLREWFPHSEIRPAIQEEALRAELKTFDIAVQMHVAWPYSLRNSACNYLYYDAHVIVTGTDFFKSDQIKNFCAKLLVLHDATTDNGLLPIPGKQLRLHADRIVIHPSSTGVQRCWSSGHFITLGKCLEMLGYKVFYILAPNERASWTQLIERDMKIFVSDSMSEVASFIHESAWFIGNESGVGHLASNVGVPTLTVTGRWRRAHCWRPAWAPSKIVYPAYLIGGRVRDRLWQRWLRPSQVMVAFFLLKMALRRYT